MDMPALNELIDSTRMGCRVILVPGSQVRAGGGGIELTAVVPFGETTSGGYRFVEAIFLDIERPIDELVSVWFHELGHFIYTQNTPKAKFSNFDSEVAAMTNEFRELLDRKLTASLMVSIANYEGILGAGSDRFPRHIGAVVAFSETPLWAEAREILRAQSVQE